VDILGSGGGKTREGTGVLIEVVATRGVNEVPKLAGWFWGEPVVGVDV
jgi:hypothetical protein